MDHRSFVVKARPAVVRALGACDVIREVHTETDGWGFRKTGPPFDPDLPSVVFLGDSFTEGLHVAPQATFAAAFRGRLSGAGLQANVINMGVNGYSPLEESWTLDTFAAQVRARVVFVNLFPNDVYADYLEVIRVGVPDARYDEMFEHLDRMRRTCEREGALLVVAAIPPSEQIVWRDAKDSFQRHVEGWCRRRSVPFVDALPSIRKAGTGAVYLGWDGHFSEQGHALYAQLLFEETEPQVLAALARPEEASAPTRPVGAHVRSTRDPTGQGPSSSSNPR